MAILHGISLFLMAILWHSPPASRHITTIGGTNASHQEALSIAHHQPGGSWNSMRKDGNSQTLYSYVISSGWDDDPITIVSQLFG